MRDLIEILEDIQPGINYKYCSDLIDSHVLDSLSVISLIAEIEENFEVTVPAVEIIPANFNSAKKIMEMILRLQEEE